MTPDELNALYLADLAALIRQQTENGQGGVKAVRHMLKEAARRPGGAWKPDRQTWVWSDLHLHHRRIIEYCKRPFADAEAMDEALLGAWRVTVGADEMMLCGGDVALAGSLNKARLRQVADCPGEKILILGNHDLSRRGGVERTGFATTWTTLLVETEPPLAFTHSPLRRVPEGVVNVHGHVHNNEPLRQGRYINIYVEHTGYRPVRLQAIVALARLAVKGQRPAGETTIEQIERTAY